MTFSESIGFCGVTACLIAGRDVPGSLRVTSVRGRRRYQWIARDGRAVLTQWGRQMTDVERRTFLGVGPQLGA